MMREADVALPTRAGKELAIPATKSFVTQLAVLYLVTLAAAQEGRQLEDDQIGNLCSELEQVGELLRLRVARWDETMRELAGPYAAAQSLIYLGRGIHYAIAREGALKMKESSYVPAEAYPRRVEARSECARE